MLSPALSLATTQQRAFGDTPASLFSGRQNGAWYTTDDNNYLTVNSDGTGGAVAIDGTVGRWLDRSGFGNHMSQATPNIRPIYRANGINCFWGTNTTTRNAFLANGATKPFKSLTFSGGISVSSAMNHSVWIDFGASDWTLEGGVIGQGQQNGMFGSSVGHYTNAAAVQVSTSLPNIANQSVVTWRSTQGFTLIRVNGAEYMRVPTHANINMTKIVINRFDGGLPKCFRVQELAVFDYDIGENNLIAIEKYLRAKAGSYDDTRSVVIHGDSLAMGTGSETYKPISTLITNRTGSRWHNVSADGGLIFAPCMTAANLALLKGVNEGLAILWLGTNDIIPGTKTGLQTAASLAAYSDTLRTAGMKVVVCTLQSFAANNVERLACNTQIAVDTSHYDAIADLAADPALDDSTDTTYYTSDGVHLMDAGYAAAAAVISTAMATISPT